MQQVSDVPQDTRSAFKYSLPPPLHAGAWDFGLGLLWPGTSAQPAARMAAETPPNIQEPNDMSLRSSNATIDECISCPVATNGCSYLAFLSIISGIASCMIVIWMALAIFLSRLRQDGHYQRLFLFFSFATASRLPWHLIFIERAKRSYFTCVTFGRVETFWSVMEIEYLTHMCVERYINARYACKEWRVPYWHEISFILISFVLASIYSNLDLVGLGRYCKDICCVTCTLDAIPAGKVQTMDLFLFFMKNYKPVMFMCSTLLIAMHLHRQRLNLPREYLKTKLLCYLVLYYVLIWLTHVSMNSCLLYLRYINQEPDLESYAKRHCWTNYLYVCLPTIILLAYLQHDSKMKQVRLGCVFARFGQIGNNRNE